MKVDEVKDLLNTPIVQVGSYQVNLDKMVCDCGAKKSHEKIPNFSWMCPHICKAIFVNFKLLEKTLKHYKKYYSAISQHAQSGTYENMSNLSGKWVYKGKKVTASILTSSSECGNNNGDFIRVMVRGRDYAIYKPSFEWCMNSMMCFQPLSTDEQIELESYVIKNITRDKYTKLNELTVPDLVEFKVNKLKKSGHRIVGFCSESPESFEAKIIFKEVSTPVRVNLAIAGWFGIKGCSVAIYDPQKDKLTLKNRLLEMFRPQLEKWCFTCCKLYKQENSILMR